MTTRQLDKSFEVLRCESAKLFGVIDRAVRHPGDIQSIERIFAIHAFASFTAAFPTLQAFATSRFTPPLALTRFCFRHPLCLSSQPPKAQAKAVSIE